MKFLALHSLSISKCKLGTHCKVYELVRFGYRKRFKWTVEHDTYMLREMLASEIWLSKAGSSERGEGCKKLADLLNQMEG